MPKDQMTAPKNTGFQGILISLDYFGPAPSQHNKRLKSFYNKLVISGKPKKVALTACMRKLVIWANAVLSSGQAWDENYAKMG